MVNSNVTIFQSLTSWRMWKNWKMNKMQGEWPFWSPCANCYTRRVRGKGQVRSTAIPAQEVAACGTQTSERLLLQSWVLPNKQTWIAACCSNTTSRYIDLSLKYFMCSAAYYHWMEMCWSLMIMKLASRKSSLIHACRYADHSTCQALSSPE